MSVKEAGDRPSPLSKRRMSSSFVVVVDVGGFSFRPRTATVSLRVVIDVGLDWEDVRNKWAPLMVSLSPTTLPNNNNNKQNKTNQERERERKENVKNKELKRKKEKKRTDGYR